jgi:hypothetical protein
MYLEERMLTLKSLAIPLTFRSVSCLLLSFIIGGFLSHAESFRVAPEHAAAIRQAIEDEVYDYSLQPGYEEIGMAFSKNVRQINVYIYANEKKRNAYNIIYKLPTPYGEVYRMVQIGEDGFAFLFGRPENGFSPSGPAFSTVYMDDDWLCKTKTAAVKLSIEIDIEPTKDRLREAITRQKHRYGYSVLERNRASRGPHP